MGHSSTICGSRCARCGAQRRSEMAIRLALGAAPESVLWLVLRQGHTLALTGATIGVMAAYISGRAARLDPKRVLWPE